MKRGGRIKAAAAAAAAIMAVSVSAPAPAFAQEVPNGSSDVFESSSRHDLDARAMGDYVPPKAELDSAFGCVSPTADPAAKKTVVLVSGVGANIDETYGWNYLPQLQEEGFDTCWVEPPHNGRGDLTQTALYVANGVKLAQQRLGKNVAILGHSAGPPASMWALRYDTEAASLVDDFIGLAGAIRGTTLIEPVCQGLGACPAVAWQMHPRSTFVQALNAKPLPESIDVTSIYSKTDEGIQPEPETSSIAGGTNVAVQDVCPGQLPGHIGILAADAPYRLVLDALNHDGPADPQRAKQQACGQMLAPGVTADRAVRLLPAVPEYLAAFGEPRYTSQPELPSYARGDVDEQLSPDEIADGSAQRLSSGGSSILDGVVGSSAR